MQELPASPSGMVRYTHHKHAYGKEIDGHQGEPEAEILEPDDPALFQVR